MAHDPVVDGVRCLTTKQVRELLNIEAMNAELATLPKVGKGLYVAVVVDLVLKVRRETRIGWAPAIRVALALHEQRLP